jgi:spore coat protein CotH
MTVKLRDHELYRFLEIAMVFVFLLATATMLLVNPSQGINRVEQIPSSAVIQAYAYAMPAEGWAPLTVYFTAFGSQSSEGEIVKYEWDLDSNGRYDTDATAAGGYASNVYKKSGDYVVTLKVTDGEGNSATDSLTVKVRYPGSSSVDYWTVFDDSQVRRVDISLTSADWNTLWLDIEEKTTVPADVVIFGERLENVGFRMRGQYSLRMSGDKKPWKIDTDFYVDGQEFHNLRQLMFLNNIGDPSMIQEKLAYGAMRFAGIPASHVCFVELWIDLSNDDQPPAFWGVYTMVERVDRKFLANRFGRDNDGGNLYKASHAERGPMDLVYYGPDITDYPTRNGLVAYGQETNYEQADYSDIIHLMYVIDGVTYETPEDFAVALEQVLNVDTFLRYMAVVNMLSNWDSYPGTGNNYLLFYNAGAGRFEWIPWDLTWGDNVRHPMFDRGEADMMGRAPLFDRVFEVERYRVRYAGYLDLLVRYWFTEENISALAYEYHSMIAPFVIQGDGDKMFFGDSTMASFDGFQDSWKRYPEFTGQRREYILSILEQDNWRSPTFQETQIPNGGK